ncbi:FHA domain-containing protein, partial [Microbacterium sp. RD12]|uniref:FHA domain-containing protein n=1 Tax=Microbacterium sp. RD12 TaxID=3035799 RepID=UPI0024698218
ANSSEPSCRTAETMPCMTSGAEPTAAPQPAPAPAPSVDSSPSEEPAAPAPAPEANRVVRPVPPSFRDGGQPEAPQMPTIRPVPSMTAVAPAAEQSAPAPAPATEALAVPGGLVPDVDKTVVTPRPTDDDLDATVVVARKRGVRRVLVLDDGRRFSLSGASVVIGRNPTGEPGEQRLAIPDTTRTLSKTHARLVVQEDEWRLTDLHATNGVVVVADDGSETLLDAGESVVGTGRFILGEVGMHVVAERDS